MSNMALKIVFFHPSENFCLLSSDLAQPCLTPSVFKDLTFLVGSQHTKKSNADKLSRTSLEIRVSSPAPAPPHPDPKLEFFFDRQIDANFLVPKVDARKEGILLLHAHPGHTTCAQGVRPALLPTCLGVHLETPNPCASTRHYTDVGGMYSSQTLRQRAQREKQFSHCPPFVHCCYLVVPVFLESVPITHGL